MNIDTGHLVTLLAGQPPAPGYIPVPPSLGGYVHRELQGGSEAVVNLRENTPLSRWAKRKRKERKQAEKRARKANRGR